MDSLRVSRFVFCRSLSFSSTTKLAPSFRPVAQVGFGYLWRKTNKNGCLVIRCSTFLSDGGSGGATGGSGSSQDGSFAVEDDKEEVEKHINNNIKNNSVNSKMARILGAERDDSGSVSGFQLLPHLGMLFSPFLVLACGIFFLPDI